MAHGTRGNREQGMAQGGTGHVAYATYAVRHSVLVQQHSQN